MATFEVTVRRGHEAEAFNAVLYRFVELKMSSLEDPVLSFVTEPMGPVERKRVTLWSDAAAQDFQRFWDMHPSRPGRPIGGSVA
ncbi:MAG TPA: hypothetical protein VL358_04045 [Caulobacteraceae bacterium]|jgi:hypothetical protein|nr:hypothetical protein [Caulobacteraceae bacterium]